MFVLKNNKRSAVIPVSFQFVFIKAEDVFSGHRNRGYVSQAMSCLRRLEDSFCVSLRSLRDSWLLLFCFLLGEVLTGDGGKACTPLCSLVLLSTLAALRGLCCFCLDDGWESFWTYSYKNTHTDAEKLDMHQCVCAIQKPCIKDNTAGNTILQKNKLTVSLCLRSLDIWAAFSSILLTKQSSSLSRSSLRFRLSVSSICLTSSWCSLLHKIKYL